MALVAGALCTLLFSFRLIRLLLKGRPKDLSKASGSVPKGVLYSCTTAMLPHNKESAYLHLPTFTAGMLFHVGIFLALLAFVWFILSTLFIWPTPPVVVYLCSAILVVTACCGLSILLKRLFKKELRSLSCADDYISNGLATLFQLATAGFLLFPGTSLPYYFMVSLLFLWLPVGKTRHLLYFFAARFHLGFFYGRRGSWPPNVRRI